MLLWAGLAFVPPVEIPPQPGGSSGKTRMPGQRYGLEPVRWQPPPPPPAPKPLPIPTFRRRILPNFVEALPPRLVNSRIDYLLSLQANIQRAQDEADIEMVLEFLDRIND